MTLVAPAPTAQRKRTLDALPRPASPAPGAPPPTAAAAPVAPAAAQTATSVAPAPPTTPPTLTSFGPGNSLIGKQISPTADPRQSQAASATSAAAKRLSEFSLEGPSRSQLALERFKSIDKATEDARNRGIQQIGQSAAKFGRIGSGKVTTDLGNLEERLQRNRDIALSDLASETAGRELADRLATFGAEQGRLGSLAGLEGQIFGQGAHARDELRGERGYQRGLSREAQRDQIEKLFAEQELGSKKLGDQMRLQQLFSGLGFGGAQGSPAELTLAQLLSQRAKNTGSLAGSL